MRVGVLQGRNFELFGNHLPRNDFCDQCSTACPALSHYQLLPSPWQTLTDPTTTEATPQRNSPYTQTLISKPARSECFGAFPIPSHISLKSMKIVVAISGEADDSLTWADVARSSAPDSAVSSSRPQFPVFQMIVRKRCDCKTMSDV